MLLPAAAFISVSVALLAIAWFLPAHLLRRASERRLDRICREGRLIALTYDDGPGEDLTARLARLLEDRGAPATFFAIGTQAESRPDRIALLARQGHEIGNHTRCHLNAWKSAPWSPVADILAGQRSLAGLGLWPVLFRPPYGKSTLGSLTCLWLAGLRPCYWTVDSRDSWEEPRPIDEVIGEVRQRQGGVILMHDCDRPPRLHDGERHPGHVLALTEAIIGLARDEVFRLVRMGDLTGVSQTVDRT